MPTAWQTFPVQCQGGLVTNTSPLQQGINLPGTARKLINFEPSVEGGYRRIKGFSKFDSATVPVYGNPVVQGSGQTGDTLVVANIFEAPQEGDSVSIDGVAGTYVVEVGGVVYDNTSKTATLTFLTNLSTSPADKAAVTFNNKNFEIEGLVYFNEKAIATRGSNLWESSGSGWTKINIPSYGTVLVDGGSQTGSTLAVDGLTDVPRVGDTFTITGVELVYAITAQPTVTSGGATLAITPALASSPADNAQITFLTSNRSNAKKSRFIRYDFSGVKTLMGVDGTNAPFKYDGTTFETILNPPSDIVGASHVVEFKNHLFFAKNNLLSFTAPYDDDNFDVADGAGSLVVPSRITGLIVFREQLIIFCISRIYRLVGSSVSDFQLQPISLDIGCIREDTIQEVGGDIIFLGPDGVRFLSATERIGDFNLALASRQIQTEVTDLISSHTDFTSCVLRKKSQYRLFGYTATRPVSVASSVLGTQFLDQSTQGISWSETRGILAYVSDSVYSEGDKDEVVIFSHRDGYVYLMESGNSFDGRSIFAVYYTPYFSFTDPRLRKTYYKLTTYLDPEGSITGTVTPRLDFSETGVIQPEPINFSNEVNIAAFYGESTYGAATYGGKLRYAFNNQLVGASFTMSLQYIFDSTDPPFSLDFITIEFATNDRQ